MVWKRWPWAAAFAANFVTIWAFISSEKVLNKSEFLRTSLLVA